MLGTCIAVRPTFEIQVFVLGTPRSNSPHSNPTTVVALSCRTVVDENAIVSVAAISHEKHRIVYWPALPRSAGGAAVPHTEQ
jgi:hypothetical protein